MVRTAATGLLLSVLAGVGCALAAAGSYEVVTAIGDLPATPQDEARVAAEVWFTIALSAVAVITTVLWWRPVRRRAARHAAGHHKDAGPATIGDPVEAARGPVGLGVATAAAFVQTGIAMLVWRATVGLRGFPGPGEIGQARIAAPILSSTSALWVTALCAALTYIVLVIVAPTSSLRSPGAQPVAPDQPQPGIRRPQEGPALPEYR